VPTRELCEQVGKNIKQMAFYCSRFVSHVQLTADAPLDVQKYAMKTTPLFQSDNLNFFLK